MIYFGDLERFDQFLADKSSKSTVERLYASGIRNEMLMINMAYYPEINTFAGRENVQIVMQDYC